MIRDDAILNQKKYTDVECFQLSSLLGNSIQTEVSFHVYVSALVGSKLFIKMPFILILQGARETDTPSRRIPGAWYLAGSCSINKQGFPGWELSPQHKSI